MPGMEIRPLALAGLFEIAPAVRRDHRGSLARLFDVDAFAAAGLTTAWVQESRSSTAKRHTVRGLHATLPPSVEGKTITALHGRMLWVSLDVRKASATFGRWASLELDAERSNTLYAARGFAHGCVSLADDCELLLRSDMRFVEQHGMGIVWDDPDLAIDWQLGGATPVISDRDRQYPTFKHFKETIGGIDA